jgi:hypothetical protein
MNADGSSTELYDLIQSPKEDKNVAGEHRDVAEKLSAKLLAWRKSLP